MEFVKYNNNPKGRRTKDCAIRAISFATNTTWEHTCEELIKLCTEKGLLPNNKIVVNKYLKLLGYKMQKIPMTENNSLYTVEQFISQIAKEKKTYIIGLSGHLTVVRNKKLYDTFNCSQKLVYNYWTKEEKNSKNENITEELDIYEKYRERILKRTKDILRLEIYETFVGTDFINNSLDFTELLEYGSIKSIIEELKYIKQNILHLNSKKYATDERIGYILIINGYLIRLTNRLK